MKSGWVSNLASGRSDLLEPTRRALSSNTLRSNLPATVMRIGGPYFEVDDQLYGGYNLVREITVGDGFVDFGLTKRLGAEGAMRVFVTFTNTSDNHAAVTKGLGLVFRDQMNLIKSDDV